jgi:hypothetical protein
VRRTVPPSAEIERRIDALLAVGVGENPREGLSQRVVEQPPHPPRRGVSVHSAHPDRLVVPPRPDAAPDAPTRFVERQREAVHPSVDDELVGGRINLGEVERHQDVVHADRGDRAAQRSSGMPGLRSASRTSHG